MGVYFKKDIGSQLTFAVGNVALAVASATTAAGTGIDTQGYGSAVVHVNAGLTTGLPTTASITVRLQHSTNNSTWANITGAALSAVTPTSAVTAAGKLDYTFNATNRYIRTAAVSALAGGTTPTIPYAVSVVLGGSDTLPAA